MNLKFKTKNLKETQELSKKIVKILINRKHDSASVLGLVGDLGGGKTSFIQGLAKNLGIKNDILSPTFILMQSYPLNDKRLFWRSFYHLDAYRTKSSEEMIHIGFEEIINDSRNIVAVEWADIIKDIIPQNALWIYFKWLDENEREIKIQY